VIELVSVEVENFRSFASATFTPLGIGQGMTAINGANGTGKSSLATHAIMWALYGVTPDGVPVKAMRRQGSTGEVKATVTFRHQGQEISVSRMLKGKNDTTVARIMVEGIEQTNVSARTAAAWVARRLGIDAEGFATAFVVKQKDLDALVRARPAERRALVERLAGIHHMSAALTKSREEARAAQGRLDAVGAIPDTEALKRALAAAEKALERARAKQEEAQAASSQLEQEYEHARAESDRISDAEAEVGNLRTKIAVLEEKINGIKAEQQQLRNIVGNAELLPDAQAVAAEAQAEVARLEEAIRSTAPIVEDAKQKQSGVDKLETTLTELKDEARKGEAECRAIEEQLDEMQFSETDISDIESDLTVLAEQVGALSGETRRLEAAINLLSNSDSRESHCPTCRGEIADPKTLVSEMTEELARIAGKREIIDSEKRRKEETLVSLRESATKLARLTNHLESAGRMLGATRDRLAQAEQAFAIAEEQAESAAEAAHGALVAQEEAQRLIVPAQKELEAALNSLRKAEEAVKAEERLNELENALDECRKNHAELATDINDITRGISGSSLSDARNKARTLQLATIEAQKRVSEADIAYAMCERDAKDRLRELRDAESKQMLAGNLAIEVGQAHALVEALDEFRRDRVARLAPELAEVASDLLLTMTDGRYSSVDLDEDFTPIVVEAETGLERPTSWLSGGEESSVALALRIAIGEVVAGQRGGLLVLDEVLTAQDQLRRNATMGAIRSLPRQIITINHVSEATDLVDLVANIVSDGDEGSRVEQLAPSGDAVDLSQVDNVSS